MKTTKSLLISLFVLVVGCSQNKNSYMAFDGRYADTNSCDTVFLTMHPIELDVAPLAPWSCCLLDSMLVIGENFNKVSKNFFKIYNEDKLLSEFGTLGNGPNDFVMPFLDSKGKSETYSIYISDIFNLKKMSLDSNMQVSFDLLPMPEELACANKILMYNDSCIVVNQTGDYQLIRYDRKSSSFVGFNYFDEAGIFSKIQNFNLSMQLFKSVYSSNNQYAVIAYHYLKMIDIVSLFDMSLHKRICFKNCEDIEYNVDGKGNISFDRECAKNYFTYVVAYDDRFFALCWDCTSEEASSGNHCSHIYEIDFDGNVLRIFQPNMAITSFAIRGKEIYAIVLDNDIKEKIICKGLLE